MENGRVTKKLVTAAFYVTTEVWSSLVPYGQYYFYELFAHRNMLEWIGYERYFRVLGYWDKNMPSANDILDSQAVSYLGSKADIPFMRTKPCINYSWPHIEILRSNKFRGLYIKLDCEWNGKESKQWREIREIKSSQRGNVIILITSVMMLQADKEI